MTNSESQAPSKPSPMSFIQLTFLYSLSILFCGRAGLLCHELIGHGLVAELLGARVTQVELHWFGGGSVHFAWELGFPQSYRFIIFFGGIFVELLTAGVLFYWSHKRPTWLTQLLACTLLAHSLFYWATSTHGDFGDGRLLHPYFPIPEQYQIYILTILFWLSCFIVARCLWQWSHRLSTRDTILQHVVLHGSAVIIAVICHGCLSYGEVHFFNISSPAHKRVFEPEYSIELAQLRTEYMKEHQEEPDQNWESERTKELQPWPHYPLFLACSGFLFGALAIMTHSKQPFAPNSPSLPFTAMLTILIFLLMWVTKSALA